MRGAGTVVQEVDGGASNCMNKQANIWPRKLMMKFSHAHSLILRRLRAQCVRSACAEEG